MCVHVFVTVFNLQNFKWAFLMQRDKQRLIEDLNKNTKTDKTNIKTSFSSSPSRLSKTTTDIYLKR